MSRFAPNWTRALYGREYLDSVRHVLSAERTEAEVELILSWTALRPPARIVDLGCGTGRHTCAFARRGFAVTGIDQNPDFVERAEQACGGDARFIVGDMRDSLADSFDLMLSLFHSFGFFGDRENAEALAMWASHLTSGGFVVLDVWNREMIEACFEPERTWEAGSGLTISERRRLDRDAGRLTVAYYYQYANGDSHQAEACFRLYSKGELKTMLSDHSLRIKAVWGSLGGERWSTESRSTVLVAERR